MAPRRRFYRRKKNKYSVEQQAGALVIPASTQAYAVVVPSTSIQGMRKVAHLTVSMAAAETDTIGAYSFWALVYVPQGETVHTLTLTGGTGMYEPNQYVLNCGVADFSAGPTRLTSHITRNLNSGDAIYLIMSNPHSTSQYTFNYVVRYAVTLH